AVIAADAEKFFPLPAALVASASRALNAAAVEPALPRYESRAVTIPPAASYVTPTGAIAIIGYNDMQEMLAALCARFTATHPDCDFALDLKGTRTAPPALASGRSLFAPMGAGFSERELADHRAAIG